MRACARANIPYGQQKGGVTWHSMTRHTGATRMVENNVHLRTLQEIGGWKTLSQLQKYGHPSRGRQAGGRRSRRRRHRARDAGAERKRRRRRDIDIAHRVRHRPDLEQLQADAIAAVKRLIAEVSTLPTADLPTVTILLRVATWSARPTNCCQKSLIAATFTRRGSQVRILERAPRKSFRCIEIQYSLTSVGSRRN